MKYSLLLFATIYLVMACTSNNASNPGHKTTVAPAKPASQLWLGKWERREWQNNGSLEIKNIKSDSMEFSLLSLNGGNTGEIEGIAIVKDNIAIYSDKNETDTCIIQFKLLSDSIVEIDQKEGLCFTGMGVTYTGSYKNSKYLFKQEKEENLKSLGIFETEKEDSLFKSLVGNSYVLFVNSTQLTSEDNNLDNFQAIVKTSGVRGLFTFMENIIITDSLNNTWAAVIDDNKIYYFTNVKEYKNKLPKTIDHWRQRFQDYPIIYK